MGGCSGKEANPYQEFNVTNINDQHLLVHSGIMYVTETELIYIDKKSREKWEWPLKYLRRYGCEGLVFSFEAGRKCPSGEGLYAFNCRKANALFSRVARNISQNNLEPTESEQPERSVEVPFPPKVQSNGTARTSSSTILPITVPSLPSTTALGAPPPLPPTSPPSNGQSNLNYTDLKFDKGTNNRPLPATGEHVNYTKIDMPKTIEVSRLRHKVETHGNGGGITRRQTTGALPGKKRSKGGSRSSSTSSSSSLNTDHHQLKIRSLDDGGNPRRGSVPDIRSVGQQRTSPPLITTVAEAPGELEQDKGELNYMNISVGMEQHHQQHSYSNMNIRAPDGPGEQSYANITVGGQDEPNYTNISVGGEHTMPPSTPSLSVLDSEPNYTNISVGGEHASVLDSEPNYTNISVGGEGGAHIVPPVTSSLSALDSEHNYSNIAVGEHNYTNISVGVEESNYQNLIPGQGLASSTPVTTPTQKTPPVSILSPDPSFSHPRSSSNVFPSSHATPKPSGSSTLPHIKGGGDSMQTYIELEINSKTSMSSYAELDINGYNTTTVVEDSERQRSQSAIVSPPGNPAHPQTDTPDSLYKELNFREMEALHKIVQDRQHLKESGNTPPVHVENERDSKKHKSKK